MERWGAVKTDGPWAVRPCLADELASADALDPGDFLDELVEFRGVSGQQHGGRGGGVQGGGGGQAERDLPQHVHQVSKG